MMIDITWHCSRRSVRRH